ncbi:MAG: putative esterase [Armatimonadetes bacterium]|jgi:enterochelin esterase-like enzyme|nr:putative esterase [Armatimonadota bacterium]
MKAPLMIRTAVLGLAILVAGAAAAEAPPVDFTKFTPYTPTADTGDYLLLPPYANAPELTPRENVPKGMVHRFTMSSTDSKLYPGISKTAPGQVVPYQRRVTVYVPSQYVPGKPAPLIVSQDSMGNGQLPTILDNMIADRRLPAIVAVMIDSGGGDAQGSQRGLEYDTVSGKYAEFIETEVLPRITKDYGVTFTKDPDARMTMGGSSGAACAFTMAWFHPELYHRVLSYSGTYVNQQSPLNPDSPHGAWEYHENFIPKEKRKPLRIWMHVGETDNRYKDDEATLHNWVMANQRMAEVLKAKKYPYQFVFARESGHVDGRVFRQTLPQALEWVWKGYRAR